MLDDGSFCFFTSFYSLLIGQGISEMVRSWCFESRDADYFRSLSQLNDLSFTRTMKKRKSDIFLSQCFFTFKIWPNRWNLFVIHQSFLLTTQMFHFRHGHWTHWTHHFYACPHQLFGSFSHFDFFFIRSFNVNQFLCRQRNRPRTLPSDQRHPNALPVIVGTRLQIWLMWNVIYMWLICELWM